MRRGSWLLVLWGSLLLGPMARGDEPAPPRIYKWVDENGIAHYTTDPERIPESLRERLRSLRVLRPKAAEAREADPSLAPVREGWAERDAPPDLDTAEAVLSVPFGETGSDVSAPPGTRAARDALDRQIAAVEAEIAQQEEVMKQLVSRAPTPGAGDLPDDPQFRATARRLPELQAELRVLREKRAHLSSPPDSEDRTNSTP